VTATHKPQVLMSGTPNEVPRLKRVGMLAALLQKAAAIHWLITNTNTATTRRCRRGRSSNPKVGHEGGRKGEGDTADDYSLQAYNAYERFIVSR
jgi:hypothetical protein